MKLLSKAGFTLAEVLITLGIIGIVAALTFPQIIDQYRKTVLKTQLKKVYSDIAQVNQRIIADGQNLLKTESPYARARLFMTYLLNDERIDVNTSYIGATERLTEIYGGVGLSYHNNSPGADVCCDNAGVWRDNIGRLWLFNDSDKQICVDINGVKAPNRYGYDYFIFYPDKDTGEKIVPYYTDIDNEYAEFASRGSYTYHALNDLHPTIPGKNYWKDYLKF